MDIQDPKQFEEIIKTYHKELIRFHYRFTNNRYDAEDLAQETFVKAYFKFHTLEDQSKLKSWLYQIARNIVIDFFRKNKKRREDVSLDSVILENMPEHVNYHYQQDILDSELRKEMDRCLNKLSTEDQKIVKMLYYEGFSYQEIGQLFNINQNTLKSRLHRARKFLQEVISASAILKDVIPHGVVMK
jgi:RNA polymerase sigma-70 factor (ECF subfamily)